MPKYYQRDFFLSRPMMVMQDNAEKFPDDFMGWMGANAQVFYAFAKEAKRIKAIGRERYSSKTIVEFLRHHTMVKSKDDEFKINNNYSAYLGRLFDLTYPEHKGLFQYRKTTKVHTNKEDLE